MVAFLAINPWLLYWGLLPVSDFLFADLVIAVFLLLRRKNGKLGWWCIAGLIGAAAYFTKVAGILIVPAVWLGCLRAGAPAYGLRGEWKRAMAITLPILAAFATWTVWAQRHRAELEHSVMWYYTDYIAFHVKNGGLSAMPEIVQANLLSFLGIAGNSVLYNLADSVPGRFIAIVILAGAISGTCRLIRRTGSIEYPLFCAFLLTVLLVWNFSPNVRLAAPAMPLLAMGLWEEAAHVASLIRHAAQSAQMSNRVAARVMVATVLGAVACAVVLNIHSIFAGLPELIQADRTAHARQRSTFEWCRRFLPSSAVVMANNDTLLYLSTGLSAVRAVPDSVVFTGAIPPARSRHLLIWMISSANSA
jgi:hypothetical protein